jgi:tRNA threonylcarbamoyladenosine biosynthesis protein TsaB
LGALLALDTSTYHAGVGVAAGGRVLERTWYSKNNHGAEILAAAEDLLREAGLSLREVDRVAVALGPGGFSALRVGIATAKGLVVPRDLPLAGISTFDIEMARWWPQLRPVVAVIDAGSAGLAWTLYEPGGTSLAAPLPGPASRRGLGFAAPADLVRSVGDEVLFCGEAAGKLDGIVGKDRILGDPGPTGSTRRPSDLIRLAEARFDSGDVDDPATLVPFYARQPSITRPRDRT